MGDTEPNHYDEAAQMHVDIVQRENRQMREKLRRLAQNLHDRGWQDARICEQLEVNSATLRRMLAADGRVRCTDCAYEAHRHCVGLMPDITRRCECDCRSRFR